MGAVIVLFLIGVILSVIHFLIGFVLEFIRAREFSEFSLKKWALCMACTAVLSFLIFGYGVGIELCGGRNDLQSCVGSVMEVVVNMGIVIFPLIILLGLFGVILGRKLSRKLTPKNVKPKTKKGKK